jgi:hypothetical protein
MSMGFELVDRYLLGEPVSKPDVLAALLGDRSDLASAQPFYRALEAVGARAADEAFIALRLVLAGKEADNDAVRRLRALATVARTARAGDQAGLRSVFKRDRAVLGDLESLAGTVPEPLDAIVAAASEAFRAELA